MRCLRLLAERLRSEQDGRQSQKSMYAANIAKYVKAEDMPKSGNNPDDKQGFADKFQAVLPSYSGKSGLDASASLKFLDTILPVSLSGSLKLNGTVDLDQISADVEAIDPDDIETLLNDPTKSGNLTKKFQDKWDGDSDIYIAYEIFSTKSFNLKTTSDTNIAPEISVGQVKVISSGSLKLTITHSDTRTLKIDSDTPYVFAFKTAKVEPRGSGWRVRIMRPMPNLGAGTKGMADKFSILVRQDTPSLNLIDRPNGLD